MDSLSVSRLVDGMCYGYKASDIADADNEGHATAEFRVYWPAFLLLCGMCVSKYLDTLQPGEQITLTRLPISERKDT